MTATRTAIPKRVEKQLYQEVGSRCPLCGEDDIAMLTIHHIDGYAKFRTHDPDEMVVLCRNCHAKADAGEIPREKLYAAKCAPRIIKFPGLPSVNQHVVGDGNIVAAGNVAIRISGREKRALAPRIAGTVCDDPRKVGYLQYLAKRYNQFREWGLHGSEPMKHGFIHSAYHRDMKYAIKTTPLELFDAGATFLQNRIANTKLGRILNNRGNPLFSRFDDFDGQGDLSLPPGI